MMLDEMQIIGRRLVELGIECRVGSDDKGPFLRGSVDTKVGRLKYVIGATETGYRVEVVDYFTVCVTDVDTVIEVLCSVEVCDRVRL